MKRFWVIRRVERDYIEPMLYKSEAAAIAAANRRRGYDVISLAVAQDADAELRRIRAVAASGTAESFLACDDDTKRLMFGLLCEDSERRKSAESRLAEAEEALRPFAGAVAVIDKLAEHWGEPAEDDDVIALSHGLGTLDESGDLTVADFRRALAAHKRIGGAG